VLQKEAIEAWKDGGAQVPRVLVMGQGSNIPFILDMQQAAEDEVAIAQPS
jgi:hypothetical protein